MLIQMNRIELHSRNLGSHH